MYREHLVTVLGLKSKPGLSLCVQGTLMYICVFTSAYSVYPCVYREHLILGDGLFYGYGLSLCVQGTLLMLGHCKN